MFGRLIFIVALFLLVFLAFRYFRNQMMLKEQKSDEGKGGDKSTADTPIKEMKPCSFCGIHMQEDEMLQKGKHHFCSYQHMQDFDNKV